MVKIGDTIKIHNTDGQYTKWANRTWTVSHIETPEKHGYGYDTGVGGNLISCNGLPVSLYDWEYDIVSSKKKKGKGWKEAADVSGKAPRHKAAATRRKVAGVSKAPQVRKEKDWKKVAKKELERELGVKTKTGSYEYYEDLDAIALKSKTGKKANNGEREWIVFKNQESADEAAKHKIRDDLETEPSLFSQDWLLSQIDDEKAERVFREIYNEWNRSYATDIKDESSNEYTNRLAEELVERGLISEEEGKDEKFDIENKIDEMVEKMTQSQIDEGNGGFEHYKGNIGNDEAKKIIMDNNLIDIDKAAENAIDVDGVAHFLDGYDGSGVDLPSGAVAYGTN